MPEITKYTRRVQPTGTQRVQSSPEVFGSSVAQEISAQGQKLQQVAQKRMNRLDTINRARAIQRFEQEALSEFARTQSEEDIVNPQTAQSFNQNIQQKANDVLASFSGSDDALAQLTADLESRKGNFVSQMNQTSINAQRKFIVDAANSELQPIIEMVKGDPSMMDEAYNQLQNVLEKNAGAMYAEDEMGFMSAASDTIARTAMESFLNAGQYREAKEIIDSNPLILNSLSQGSKKTIVSQISQGLEAENKAINETRNKMRVVQSMADDLGVDVSPSQLFTAGTGIELKENPIENLEQYAQFIGTSVNDLPPQVIAKHGFGIDLPDTTKMTEERKFIVDTIKSPITDALTVKTRVDSVLQQANSFLETGNQQAGLAAMIAFQKLIDDGAAVREGDIKLSAEGISAFDKIKLQLERIEEGAIAEEGQMREIMSSAEIFLNAALSSRKTFIDPYLADAAKAGLAPRQVGIPQQSYNQIFGSVKNTLDSEQETQGAGIMSMEDIEGIAAENGMTVDELIQATASSSGKSVEQVRKDFGFD